MISELILSIVNLQNFNNELHDKCMKLVKERESVYLQIESCQQKFELLQQSIQQQIWLFKYIEHSVCDDSKLSVANIFSSDVDVPNLIDTKWQNVFNKFFKSLSLDPIDKKIKNLHNLSQFKTHTPLTPKLKIAVVMDEFSFAVFSHEADVLQLTIDNYVGEIESFKPDLLLIESAWFGYKKQWKAESSIVGSSVFALIRHCSLNNIITAFWNKEDPTHFEHFLPLARMVNFVFTTEENCVPIYKHLLGHKRVHLLQFAVQPKLHNPVEKYTRQDKFCFAGAYYYQHPERQHDFDKLIDTISKFKQIRIYDRNFRSLSQYNRPFPDAYRSLVGGRLEFREIDRAYKGYKYAINLNTVKLAKTMCSRRIFELMASNTLMVSNWSGGMKNIFGNLVFSSDDPIKLDRYLEVVCNQPIIYSKLCLLALRKVMMNHTYFDRLSILKAAISGNTYVKENMPILIIAMVSTLGDAVSVIQNFNAQTYNNKQLYIVKCFKFGLKNNNPDIKIFINQDKCIDDLVNSKVNNQLLGFFSPVDYYGPNYLLDLSLGVVYSSAHAFGKASYYVAKSKECKVSYIKKRYKPTSYLKLRRSLVRREYVRRNTLQYWLSAPDSATVSWRSMLSIDEFNYCKNGMKNFNHKVKDLVDDLSPQILEALNG